MRATTVLYLLVSLSLNAACSDDPTIPVVAADAGDRVPRDTNRGVDAGTILDAGTNDDTGTITSDPEPVGDTGTEPGPPTHDYDRVGFDAASVQVTSDGANITFQGVNAGRTDVISVASYADWAGPTTPGTYSLDGINYADCGLCLIIAADCDSNSCAKTFYADAGTVDITAIGFGEGEQFQGTLQDVVFTEVTIARDTFESTPVPGGETWLVDNLEFNGFVSSAPQAGECDSGRFDCIGETVSSFSLQSCDTGELVDVADANADADGTWMILTAGWCSACHTWIPQVFDALANELAEFDINLMIVLGEDTRSGQPSLEYCRGYADQYRNGRANFYLDHDGAQSYATVFSNVWIYPGEGGAFGLPWNGMFRGGSGEYVYADGAGVGDINTGLNEMLR